jgi:hypothetical protein
MRFLGGLVALLLVTAGCTTRAEIEVHDNGETADRFGRLPLSALLSPPPLVLGAPRYLDGWPVGADGIVVRIDLHGDAPAAGMYSFADDGTVVRAADTSVTMSREDLTTWTLSRLQLETVLGALDALGVREAEPGSFGDATVRRYTPSGNVSWDTGRVIGGDDQRLMETLYAVTEPPAHGVRRWTPTAIGFLAGRPNRTARSPLSDEDPFARWPLQRGIRELATGTARNAYDEEKLALCVIGRDAARVWRHLFTGVNTAYLRVDDGRKWELQSSVVLPDYAAYGSPCSFR